MRVCRLGVGIAFLLAAVVSGPCLARAQAPAAQTSAAATTPAPEPPAGEPPPLPKGVEVLTRGPVHEAFASLTADPAPTKPVPKRPPKPLDELPPDQKPEGDVLWISGYWHFDDERNDYLWVSGVWRAPPPHKQWVAGYWREDGEQWQWVPGFWAAAAEKENATQEVTYLPEPPKTPETAPPGPAPNPDTFYVPGTWVWNGAAYVWRAGYWARVQPGYVWVPAHYRWTPTGYVYIPGYWDLAVSRRGTLYAPVYITPAVVTVGFTYTPVYAVSDTVVVDALFVRPAYCHYYFGDYYGPAYVAGGYESVVVYSGRRYDSIIVYETWAHRSEPAWLSVQVNLYNNRVAGLAPVPPRTFVQQNTIIQNNVTNVTNVTNINNVNVNRTTNYNTTVVAPASTLAAAKGAKTVALDPATRQQALRQASAVQQVAQQRTRAEVAPPAGAAANQPRVASLSVPKAQPVRQGMVAPAAPSAAAVKPAAPAVARPMTAGPGAAPHAPTATPTRPGQPSQTATHAPPAPGARPGTVPPPPPGGTAPRPGAPGQPANAQRPGQRPPPPPARRPPPRDPHQQQQDRRP
jgi:hypothetical protein